MTSAFIPLQDETTHQHEKALMEKSSKETASASDKDAKAEALPNAFVTMLTTSAYLPGALVLLHALKDLHPEPRDFRIVCLVTPETVDARTVGILRGAGYDLVIGVEPISSGSSGQSGLRLMGRPDLDLALTKLHIFRLGSLFASVIYLDADTLPLRPLSHLFKVAREHTISACPDSGWPDCFNSGVMVVRPQSSDFDNLWDLLRKHSEGGGDGSGNGSFDGADQGLLNLYFSEEGQGEPWHRLPFTYNVTPSAAYQYAPAYKHYARNINLIHFIGSRKPWTRLANRPAGLQATQGSSEEFEYESLIDRWYAIYDRYVRPTAAHEPNLAKRFAVPEHIAVWNRDGVNEQPARLDLDALKEAAAKGVTSLQSGQYLSLPLEGRVDLMRPKATQDTAKPVQSPALSVTESPPPAAAQPVHQPAHTSGEAWDAAWQPPPQHSRPEMSTPMPSFYTAAWDEPPRSQSTYFQTHTEDTAFPTLPANVRTNDWYQAFTSSTPDPLNVQPVFPWEVTRGPQPRRTFPKAHSPAPAQTSARGMASKQPPPRQASALPASQVVHQAAPTNLPFSEAISAYTNAWDNVAAIGRYAERLTKLGVATGREPQDGLQTVPPSPKLAGQGKALPRHGSDSGSGGSADGDDECDLEERRAHEPRSHRRTQSGYRDKTIQTDWPRSNDAVAQTTTEASRSGTGAGASAWSSSTMRGQRATSSDSLQHARSPTQQPTGGHTPTARAGGRVWDPRTDIDARKKDTQNVLSRFMQG